MKYCMGCMRLIEDQAEICPHCGYREGSPTQEAYYLTPGTILQKRYIVGRVLGYGGFGITYIGCDTLFRRTIAIKEYFPSDFVTRGTGSEDVLIYSGEAGKQFKDGLDSFLSEASRLAKFNQAEGIVQIYDCIRENGTGYIIMEYLKGMTVKEILAEKGKYSYEEALQVILSVAGTLQEVHQVGIIHRDIAPDNIFITDEGNIKLLDFGAARYATTANSKSLSIILKPGYAPEEQYRSRGHQGPWTDVYALGATFYRMITGQRPEDAIERLVEDHVYLPSNLGADITAGQEAVLMKSLNVRAEDRYQSAKEFREALLAEKPKAPDIPEAGKEAEKKEEPRKKKGKKPLLGAAIAALCLVLGIGAAVFMKRGVTEPESELQVSESETQMTESELQASESETQITESELQASESETQITESELQASESETQMTESELQTAETQARTENRLVVWAWDQEYYIPAIREAGEIYKNTVDESLELEVAEYLAEDIETRLQVSAASGDVSLLPDIILMQDTSFQRYIFSYPEMFIDLTDSGIDFSQFAKGNLSCSMSEGKNYGVPLDSCAVIGCWRRDIFEEAGVDYPMDVDWQEFIEIGKAIKQSTGHYLLSGMAQRPDIILMMLQSAGASLFHEDGTPYIEGNDALAECIEIYQRMVQEGIFYEVNGWDEYIVTITNGICAGTINGNWIMSYLEKTDDTSGLWKITDMPRLIRTENATNYSKNGGTFLCVTPNCQNTELAFDFLARTFGESIELYENILNETGMVGVFAPAAASDAYQEPREFWGNEPVFAAIEEFAQKTPAAGGSPYYYETCDAVYTAVMNIMMGADMETALREAQEIASLSYD